jgi:hypothetical protein
MDTTDTGIDLTCASTIPSGPVSPPAGAAGGGGGASFRTGLGFGLVFGFDFVSGGTQVGTTASEPLGCAFSLPSLPSLPDSGGLGSEDSAGGAGLSVVTGGGLCCADGCGARRMLVHAAKAAIRAVAATQLLRFKATAPR